MEKLNLQGKKIRCVGKRIGKPVLIRQSDYRVMAIVVEGKPTKAEVVVKWRIKE